MTPTMARVSARPFRWRTSSSTRLMIFAVVLMLVVLGLEWWLLPALIGWTLGLLLLGLLVSAVIQLLLGHRGWCWLWRTLRWWLGPIGTLVDPLEMG